MTRTMAAALAWVVMVTGACSGGSGANAAAEDASADASMRSDHGDATSQGDVVSDARRRADASSADASRDGGALSCVPNATLACACPANAGSVGIRQCLPDGTRYRACACETYGAQFAVSPTGHDTGAGTLADPFQTLARAQSAVRAEVDGGIPAGGVVVWVRGGTFEMTQTFTLTAADSGGNARPVVYSGYPGESANLVGGKALDPSAFTSVTSASPVWSRLDASAQGRVVVASLPALGVTDYGTLKERGFCNSGNDAALELSINGVAMPLARWPDADADSPAQSDTGANLTVYGSNVSPDVTGAYVKTGTADGVSQYARTGLVSGKQYNLHRWTSGANTAWFITTTMTGYPTNTDPWWYLYSQNLGAMTPNNGADGSPSFADPEGIDHGFAMVTSAPSAAQFGFASTRPARWSAASDAWVHGMFAFDWADCHEPITKIDTTANTITLAATPGYAVTTSGRWYAENLLEEITEPGEWYLDRTTGDLYLWPPSSLAGATVVVSTLSAPLVSIAGAANVTLQHLTLESGRAQLIDVANGRNVAMLGLTLRNAGTSGATIQGQNVGVSYAHVYGTGGQGISLAGGDRPTLTPGDNFVEDSNLHDFGRWTWMYQPGVSLSDVGNRASHNKIHDSPHAAILYGGNNQTIELNEIYNACQYTADAGAIYAGRDWGARGNVISDNYLHGIKSFLSDDVSAIYLDDCLSGIVVQGNIVDGVGAYGVLHGGGRDNLITDNVLARCGSSALYADARCLTWLPQGMPNHTAGDSWDLLGKLEADNYQNAPWASAFPACAAIPDDWSTIIAPDAGWLLPHGSEFSRNLGFANGAWVTPADSYAIPAYASMTNNAPDAGDVFVDEDAGNVSLTDAASAAVPGLQAASFGSIGIQP